MKTSDINIDLSNSSFLIIGDSGTGKTRLAGTFPKPYFFDMDKGMASLRGMDIEYDTFKDSSPKGTPMPDRGIYPYGTAWQKFMDKANEIGEQIDKGTCPFETLVVDSVTTLTQICMNYVLKQKNKVGGPPEIQHYGMQMELLKTVFDQLTSWPLIKVVVSHVQRTENQVTEQEQMLPLVTGKLAGLLPVYFDEVYFTDVRRIAGKTPEYYLHTSATASLKCARTRFGVPEGTLSAFSEIKKALENAN